MRCTKLPVPMPVFITFWMSLLLISRYLQDALKRLKGH